MDIPFILRHAAHAHDTVILKTSKEGLQDITRKLNTASERWGYKLNKTKTKIMILDRNENTTLHYKTVKAKKEEGPALFRPLWGGWRYPSSK